MKRTVTIKENQDFFDVVIQEFGGVEYYFDAMTTVATAPAERNDRLSRLESLVTDPFPTPIPSGYVLDLANTENIGESKVISKLKLINFVVNNAGEIDLGLSGIGIGIWIIENDFVVQ